MNKNFVEIGEMYYTDMGRSMVKIVGIDLDSNSDCPRVLFAPCNKEGYVSKRNHYSRHLEIVLDDINIDKRLILYRPNIFSKIKRLFGY